MTKLFSRRVFGVIAVPTVLLAGCSGSGGTASAAAPLAASEFRAAAAQACTAAINHRRLTLGTYRADREVAIEAVLLAMDKDHDHPPDEIAAATGRLADEHRRTADELALVRAAEVPDQQAWDRVVQAQRDRAAALDRRQQLVAEERFDQIEPGSVDVDDGEALTHLGLQDRDCRLLGSGG